MWSKFTRKRVLLLGATGTIGRATARALVNRGHEVVCLVRTKTPSPASSHPANVIGELAGATVRVGNITDPASIARDGIQAEPFDALVSCLASRTGISHDAWAIDYQAHVNALQAAQHADVQHMVLLSAICVQKPVLAFQKAKLAFEKLLVDSGMTYSIVRPTAYFKSLSGQIDGVKAGRPFLVFGDGTLTACKPISDDDLGAYLADCLTDAGRHNRILPIGGPGPAITPKQQGEHLFHLLGQKPRFRHVPVRMLDGIVWSLDMLGRASASMAAKAELARIGRYYATESMLVWNPEAGRYDAAATPSTGTETLCEFYEKVIAGHATVDLGDHAVF